MAQIRVALVGISGVGKSTILNTLKDEVPLQCIQVSALIKEASKGVSQDKLRERNIEENQKMFLEALKGAVNEDSELVVLDAHTVIDTPSGYEKIGAEIFEAAQIKAFIFLADDPAVIETRRHGDDKRGRPKRSKEELAHYQEMALISAFETCIQLKIPLHLVTSGSPYEVVRILNLITSKELQP